VAPPRHLFARSPAAMYRPSGDTPAERIDRRRGPRWSIALAVCALGLTFAPAHARSDAIWEGNDQSVLLAPQDDEAATPNDHPVSLAPRDIERMLADLRFRYADQEADAPPAAVFNREQIEILGEALATGLTRAAPSQDVTFSVVGAHRLSPGALARRNRVTAGRVFFRDGKLNVILGEIQSPYRKKNIYGRIEEDFHPRRYGSRTAPQEQESLLVGSALARLQAGPDGASRHDWAVFDADLAATDPAAGSPAADEAARPASPAASGQSRAGPAPAAPGSEGTAATRAATLPPGGGLDDIEQRLETLKRLREKDLISEEAYRQKVDEILEDL
jgi:hypothetical protein